MQDFLDELAGKLFFEETANVLNFIRDYFLAEMGYIPKIRIARTSSDPDVLLVQFNNTSVTLCYQNCKVTTLTHPTMP